MSPRVNNKVVHIDDSNANQLFCLLIFVAIRVSAHSPPATNNATNNRLGNLFACISGLNAAKLFPKIVGSSYSGMIFEL